MKTLKLILIPLSIILFIQSCNKDNNVIKTTPPSEGSTIDATVGGNDEPNQVFINLSSDNQVSVARNTWDLAFSCTDGYNVILNVADEMLAYKLDKTELNQVTSSDTVGLGAKLSLGAIFSAAIQQNLPDWLSGATSWTDDPTGDFSKTAIASVSEVAVDNAVYIINRGNNPDGTPRGWEKIKISQSTNGYVLQHGTIDASTPESLNVTKDPLYNFIFIDLDNGPVSVEPKKADWDIAFTTYTDLTDFGIPYKIPYFFKDYVIQNRYKVSIAEVMEVSDLVTEFNNFALPDLSGVTFSNDVNSIGSSWRTIIPQVGSAQVNNDRFYVIKDTDGNYYKLVFTKMVNSTGDRGYPEIKYALIK